MKKFTISFLATLLTLGICSRAQAADVSVGATVWYASWDFKSEGANGSSNKKIDPELMFGPLLSVKFLQNWSVSTVFLYSSKYTMPQGESGSSTKLTRMDSDTLINYNLNRYLKVFTGLKYMRFMFSDGYHYSVGPGAGLGLTIPLFDNFYMITNGSGSYLFGTHKTPDNNGIGMREYGCNITATLAYYISAISTTVNAGYRYQIFKTKYDKNTTGDSSNIHTFRGFTASVVYSF